MLAWRGNALTLMKDEIRGARRQPLADRVAASLRDASWAVDPAALSALAAADRWLCLFLRPIALRQFWRELWVRADEFHPSLNLDHQILAHVRKRENGWKKFWQSLERRRNLAHDQRAA